MPDHRQKKLAKHKIKRATAAGPVVRPARAALTLADQAEVIAALPSLKLGPFFITRGWDDPSTPRLHAIIGTRRHPTEQLYVPVVIIVDLGFHGVTSTEILPWHTPGELRNFLIWAGKREVCARGMEQIKPSYATTIVRSAVAHASFHHWCVPPDARPGLAVLPQTGDPWLIVECGRDGKPVVSRGEAADMNGIANASKPSLDPDDYEIDTIPNLREHDRLPNNDVTRMMGRIKT